LFNKCRAVQAQSFVNPQAGSHAQDQVGPFAARAEDEKHPEEDRGARRLEAIIAQTLAGEQVQYEGKPIGSVDQMTRKLTELKLKRSGDPDYLIFVGIDRFGECFLTAFSTMGDPREFRLRHDKQLDRAAEGLFPAGMSPQPT
jgi:hypothetical protein